MRWICPSAVCLALSMVIGSTAAGDGAPAGQASHRAASANDRTGKAFFEEHIQPLLAEHCYKCHSRQAKNLRGGLRLDSREDWVKGGDNGPVIVPGDPARSLLIQAVRYQGELKMPPKARLAQKQIDLLVRWIRMGAPDPRNGTANTATGGHLSQGRGRDHWAFRPLRVSPPPLVEDREHWCRTPIDQFILAGLAERGLYPNPAADRRTLIRRAFFDLLGLPPTPEEVAAFLHDPDPNAYEKLLDRLLASPHYGERWACHWMDVARFAESHGYEQDYDRPYAYPYRDFLIQALNEDMPYNQFVRWQIAGDELAPNEPQALAATGFLGGGAFPTQLTEAEFESARYDELDDMVGTTGLAFLGLSIGCARCHDHKFDPITTHDYYRLAATFTTTIRSEIDVSLYPGQAPTKMQVSSEGFPPTKHHADERGFPHFYKETYFLQRGDPNQKRGVASPSFLPVLMRDGKDESYWRVSPPAGWTRTSFRRASLAHWLTDAEHGAGHLAARVIVNRVWQHHFGRGLVATPNDFGTQGEPPSHPELLDWLANDLIRHGWRLKRLHRLIMASAVYRQDGRFDEARARIDRENVFLWRRAPRRLEAEPIRDAMLQAAGALDLRMYGPGTLDPNMRRRSVYFFIKRSQLIPMMMLFDWPEHLVSIGQRATTTTAPQALLFMNSPQGQQYAEGLAHRLEGQADGPAVDRAYRIAFSRAPTAPEKRLALDFLSRQKAAYRETGRVDAEQRAWIDLCRTLLSMNEFIYVE
jgi:mono/diheme cytochrome c family protein